MQKTGTQVISEQLQMEIVAEGGETTPLGAQFSYDPADPFAVTVRFGDSRDSVEWTFGRELLTEGLYTPVGAGDVQVWPCLSADGTAVVILELASPAGEVMLQVATRAVADFVQSMLARTPLGAELAEVDLDDEITALLAA